jgi:hypothetical protein
MTERGSRGTAQELPPLVLTNGAYVVVCSRTSFSMGVSEKEVFVKTYGASALVMNASSSKITSKALPELCVVPRVKSV